MCFATERYKEFRKYQLQNSSVKIKYFRLSNTGNDDILMNKKTTLEVQMKVDDFAPIELDEGIILPISQLDKILVRPNSFPESYHKKPIISQKNVH